MKPRRKYRLEEILVAIALLSVAVYAGNLYLNYQFNEESIRVNRVNLSGVLKWWDEVGRPEGEALQDFMKGNLPKSDIVISNFSMTVDGTNFQCIFGTRLDSSGMIFITTNGTLLVIDPPKKVRVIRGMMTP